MPDNYPPLVSSAKLWNAAAVTRGDGLRNHSAIKIQLALDYERCMKVQEIWVLLLICLPASLSTRDQPLRRHGEWQ